MYGIEVIITATMQQAEEKTIEALKTESFGVLTEIDVQGVLKKKIDVDRTPFKILGACNPVIANDVLNIEANVGLLLPCNVVIRAVDDAQVSISIIDPEAMFTVVDNEQIKPIIAEVKAKFERIMKLIAS